MAKQKSSQRASVQKTPPPLQAPSFFRFSDFRTQALVISIIGFVFYFNSFFNGYALDDGIVIGKNEYVQQGIRGIPKILSKDAYDSFYRQMNAKDQLSGGRYRPLSIVTFAIEQEFFGTTPDGKLKGTWDGSGMQFRHVVNVLLYIFSTLVLLYFLRTIVFPLEPDMAFIAALLFIIHPIHTEVVANVKSRDEIMSLLFICLTFIYAFRYQDNKKQPDLLKALLCFFLALLSKEYAVTLVVLLPLSFYLFRKYSWAASFRTFLPYTLVLLVYILIRFSVVVFKAGVPDNEVLNNPYLFAKGTQKLATEISTTLNYLKLLFFPHPLSADYSYNAIPYKTFGNPLVILSLLVHASLLIVGFRLLKNRNVLAFAIAFYFAYLFLVCNIFLNIGATMGERLIYHSSVGFAIAIAFLLVKGVRLLKMPDSARSIMLTGLLVIVVIASGFKTIERNAVWKNDITLFINDVNTVPNSALANGNAGARYIDLSELPENKDRQKELLLKAISYLDKAIHIHERYVTSYINRGLAYYKLGDLVKTKENWDMVEKYYPHYPDIPRYRQILSNGYLNQGLALGKEKKYSEAIAMMQTGLQIAPENPEIWYNLGGAYYTVGDYQKALEAWGKTLQLKPDHQQARQGYAALKNRLSPVK